MLLQVLGQVSLYQVLHRIDKDLCAQERAKGCPFCGGPLRCAFYGRKPRGGPSNLPEEWSIRMSLCCGREGCRSRVLPPSCLFLGRRVYWGAVVLVVTALRGGRDRGASASKLMEMFQVYHSTLVRWLGYFREVFPGTPWWQRLRGLVAATVDNRKLPESLLAHFMAQIQDPQQGVVGCLAFLAQGATGR